MSTFEGHEAGPIVGGDYRILRRIAEGGMATVFEAQQLSTGALRALKILRPPREAEEVWRPRFEREVRMASAISSDHVVRPVGAGIDEALDAPWIAMERLEGEDLAQRLRRDSRLDLLTLRVVVEQMGHALSAAHSVRVVHRDLKPANVFLAKPTIVGVPFMVKLLDFGIAKWVSEAASTPTPNLGTPAFMAPEQCEAPHPISPATDLWAFGLLMFRALTGQSFWLSSRAETPAIALLMREVLFDPIPRASERLRQIDGTLLELPGFDAWFARCLQRDPALRFESADRMVSELLSVLDESIAKTRVAVRSREPALDVTARWSSSDVGATEPAAFAADEGVVRKRFPVEFRDISRQYRVEVAPGESLLAAVHRAGAPLHAECGGHAMCTTCRVSIVRGAQHASEREGNEATLAEQRGWPASTRLSCQLKVRGAMTVRRMVSSIDDDLSPESLTFVRHRNAPERLVVAQATLVGIDEFSRAHLPFDAIHVLERFVRGMIEPALPNGARVLSTHSAGVLLGFSTAGRSVEAATEAAVRSALRMRPRLRHINNYTARHFAHRFSLAVGVDVGEVILVEMSVVPGKDPAFIGHAVLGANRAAAIAARAGASIVVSESARAMLQEMREGEWIEEQGERFVSVVDFAKPDVVAIVQETYERVLERRDEFSHSVYRRFLSDPSVAAMFAGSNMATQGAMFMGVLHRAVQALDRFESIEAELRELGQRHASFGVTPAQFRCLGQALSETLREMLGAELTDDAELAWMELYSMLVRAMLDGARGD
ncbi:MAG: protein kinase [Polyangiales bacterium]